MTIETRDVVDHKGYIVPDALLDKLHITQQEFARAIGLSRSALSHRDRLHAASTQQRLRQIVELLQRIEPWAGSLSGAWSWYRTYPLAPLGDLTAEELFNRGRADDVRAHLSRIAEGGYA